MNKYLNGLLVTLLLISFWVILSVELQVVPLFRIQQTQDFCTSINRLILTLSYSFIAGLIVYFLTVVIPFHTRNKIYKQLISNIITNYYKVTLYQYYQFCADIEINDPYICKYQANILQKRYRIPVPLKQNIKKRFERLCILSAKNDLFINMLIPYELYLSNEQLIIFRDIRIHTDKFNEPIIIIGIVLTMVMIHLMIIFTNICKRFLKNI